MIPLRNAITFLSKNITKFTAMEEIIRQAMVKAQLEIWCQTHGINPSIVEYKDGKVIIPLNF